MNHPPRIHIWSAVPTPLTDALRVDGPSVRRMVDAAVADRIDGLFLCGTCGEGPWLPDRERSRLIRAVAAAARGRLRIAAQVSDNSVPRILDNIKAAESAGADYAIIAPPSFMMNATPDRITALFTDAITRSPLPIGIYDLGCHRPFGLSPEHLTQIYLQPNVRFVKDSSATPERRAIALAARENKRDLLLFNGDEFHCLQYLEAGYDGLMFGGAVAVAAQMHRIVAHFHAGELDEAREIETAMRETLYGIYGGRAIACWLTGLKHYLVRKGVFTTSASFLDYPLTAECRAFIENSTKGEPARGGRRPERNAVQHLA